MALDVYFREQIGRAILAGLVAVVRTSQAHGGGNVEFVRGAAAMAEHQAVTFGLDWQALQADLRRAIAGDTGDAQLDG